MVKFKESARCENKTLSDKEREKEEIPEGEDQFGFVARKHWLTQSTMKHNCFEQQNEHTEDNRRER